MKKTCTNHCCGCGCHFNNLKAFDYHRVDGFCEPPLEVQGIGKDGGKRYRLAEYTREGYCDHTAGCWRDGRRLRYEHPVTIYQTAMSDKERQRLAALKGR